MKKHPRLLLWCIMLLTIATLFIDLPKWLPVWVDVPNLPLINQPFRLITTLGPFHPDFWIGNNHVYQDWQFRRGLDLAGGTSVTLQADMHSISPEKREDALEGAKNIIEKRINLFGVSEPVIQTAKTGNEYRIIVELPGVSADQAMQLVGKTAQLSFWEDQAEPSGAIATTAALPLGILQLAKHPHKTELTGKDLLNAQVVFDSQSGKPQVQPTFTSEGVKKFAAITRRNLNKVLIIALDNQVISYPVVQSVITDGNVVITGFTTEQAKAVSIQLRAGALPVPLTVLQQNSIGATLGSAYLNKSLFAGILGFFVLGIFMIVLYGRLGMIAVAALALYTMVTLAIFKTIPVTLTLAGIAGFILSIGMAVDANILIFERMKEELRMGKSLLVAIELGFSRAWTSIRDSNVSTLITSSILYYFGTGIVRGFAFTLAIGVVVSLFSAIIVTRTGMRIFYKPKS